MGDVLSPSEGHFVRHRKPKRYRGQHRSPALAPRTRYGIVVSTALVGAGVIAFGAGTALPQPAPDAASAALERSTVSGGGGLDNKGTPGTESPQEEREPQLLRASRGEQRDAAPAPEKLPDWVRPAAGFISSSYGYRPEYHGGTDVAVPLGSPIYAASDGIVKKAGWYGGYGIVVIIEHADGVVTYYGHNSAALVEEGQHVTAGDTVAKSGSTGQSTGPHLHFEVRVNGERINPQPFMRDRGVDF